MYLRTTQRKNTDSSIVRYEQLAHNHRVDGVTQAKVPVDLGREDRLDRKGRHIRHTQGWSAVRHLPGAAAL